MRARGSEPPHTREEDSFFHDLNNSCLQLDLRHVNSWRLKLGEVSSPEAAEVCSGLSLPILNDMRSSDGGVI